MGCLRELSLAHNHIDDCAMGTLEMFPKLEELDLFNTDVTSNAERHLRQVLPRCHVRFVRWASGDVKQP